MENETFLNFKAIISNPQSPAKLAMDTVRTINYSYPQTDPDVITLNAIATVQNIPFPATTNPGAAGLADYSYCTVADLQAAYGVTGSWRGQDPGLAND